MKITIISSLFAPFSLGGAEQVAEQLATTLHDAGHEVDVVTTCRRDEVNGQGYVTSEHRGIRVWRIAPWNLYWRYDREHTNPGALVRAAWHFIDLWNPSTARPLLKVLSRIQPDVVNTHNVDGLSPVVWQVARRRAKRVVHTVHDGHLLCPRAIMQRRDGRPCDGLCQGCRVYSSYHARFQGYVDALISPSKDLADLHRSAGWEAPTIAVVPNTVPVEQIAPAPMPQSAPLQVVFMARLVPEKGCAALLNTIRHFANVPGIEFHVAGRGPFADQFVTLAKEVSNLRWHDHVSGNEKSQLLSIGDVFLVLSEWRENAPLSLIEAKRGGLYVVGTDMGGIPEMIAPGDGELIPPGNIDVLNSTLRRLVSTRDSIRASRRARMDRAGGYDVRDMADRYLQVFQAREQL